MKKNFILFCFFFMPYFIFSQEEIFKHPLNSETMNVFVSVCSNLSKHKIVTGNFDQERILTKSNRTLKSSGNFIIEADLGLVWDTITPVRSSLTLGSDYIIQSRGNRRTVTSAQGNEIFLRTAEVIKMIFTGNTQGLLDNFDIYFSGNSGSWEAGLIPKSGIIQAYMQEIIIKGDSVIRYIQIKEQPDDIIIYKLNNHKNPQELNADEKTFFIIP